MKVLVDADFLLEALLNRQNLIGEARKLWKLLENKEIEGLVTHIGVKKICIFVDELGGSNAVKKITSVLKNLVEVKTVDRDILEEARSYDSPDFESAVEIVCAYEWGVSAIVTHNPQSFSQAELQILSISEVLEFKHLEKVKLLKVPIETRNKIVFSRLTLLIILLCFFLSPQVIAWLWDYINNHLVSYDPYSAHTYIQKNRWISPDFYDDPLSLGKEYDSLISDLYDHSKEDILISSDFYDDPLNLGEQYNGLRRDFYDYTEQNILKSLDFCNDPISLGEDYHGLIRNFYEIDTNILDFNVCTFNMQSVDLLDNEDLSSISHSTDLQGSAFAVGDFRNIPEFEDTPSQIALFTVATNTDPRTILVTPDATVPEIIENFNNFTPEESFTDLNGLITTSPSVPEPSAIISLIALGMLGLGYKYNKKKNKQINSKNNVQKPSIIPPIAGLDVVVDHSTNNKGNG